MPDATPPPEKKGERAELAQELRRPLGVIQGYVAMLLEGHLGALAGRQRQALLHIQGKLSETQNELERLLLEGRLESDAIAPALRRVDLVQEAESAIERAQARIELAGGSLGLERPPFAIPALADSGLLARILDNLFENAITYAVGSPRVSVQAGLADAPFLRVCDAGRGIDPGVSEQIFARGFRADPAGSRPGSGLGLYLSRQAAHLMEAQLWVEWTEPGRGSCFRLDMRPDDFPGPVGLG